MARHSIGASISRRSLFTASLLLAIVPGRSTSAQTSVVQSVCDPDQHALSVTAPSANYSSESLYWNLPLPYRPAPRDAAASICRAEITQVSPERAFLAYRSFQESLASRDFGAALIAVETFRAAAPSVLDWADMLEGRVRMEMGQAVVACPLFERASFGPSRTITAEARLAYLECLFVAGDVHARDVYAALRTRYRDFPRRAHFDLLLAQHFDRFADFENAIRVYRELDLQQPGSSEAQTARERLQALANEGKPVPSLSLAERVERARALYRQGPMDQVEAAVSTLVEDSAIVGRLRSEVMSLWARVLRNRGDIVRAAAAEADAVRGTSITPARPTEEEIEASAVSDAESARRLSRSYIGRALSRARKDRVVMAVRVLARAGLATDLNELLGEIPSRVRGLSCVLRKEMVELSLGLADAEKLEPLIAGCDELSYLRARVAELRGDHSVAASHYTAVVSGSDEYRKIWASAAFKRLHRDDHAQASLDQQSFETLFSPQNEAPFWSTEERDAQLARLAHAYPTVPWLSRAAFFLSIGDQNRGIEELFELQWMLAQQRGSIPRAGLEGVLRGAAPSRETLSNLENDGLRRLAASGESRALAEIARSLGEHGLAIRLGGGRYADVFPLPYRAMIDAAAARFDLDPYLLYAVMRTESFYNSRIVSYAGAVGLLQIMPRTGLLISKRLGHSQFSTGELLNPETNITFAAWYLSSLRDRFDGRLPLAIAAYNAGPANVRSWMSKYPRTMAVDLFCDRIPIDQTYRYVRRVLLNYAAYRAQAGLGVPDLEPAAPTVERDTVAF